jgi:predicted protein tyrosine phosphatase
MANRAQSQYLRLFDERQAVRIMSFLENVKRRQHKDNQEWLIVHCDAGIARSGAVAQTASDFIGDPLGRFRDDNPHIHPNPHVHRLLFTEWHRRECGA